MSFLIDGYPCEDPRSVLQACRDASLPMDFAKRCNVFGMRLGGQPVVANVLIKRQYLNKLNIAARDDYRTLTIIDTETGLRLVCPKLIIADQIEAVTPGHGGDASTVYWLKLADKRWLHWDRGDRITEGYNLRGDTVTDYITSTTNSGTAWTWQLLLNELWPASGFGTTPTLPFTPHGTPEGFWFYRESRMRAVDYLLTRLACGLRYDPIDDVFDIIRLGVSTSASHKAATKAATTLMTKRVYDHYPLSPRTALYPEKIRTQFRVRRPYSDGTMPYYTSDVTVSPAASSLGTGTIVTLEDDLTALWDGSTITNSSTLTARAAERAADWIRKRQYHDVDQFFEYRGFHDLRESVGSLWRECSWYDVGAGARSRVYSGRVTDTELEDWQRAEYYGVRERSTHYWRNFDGTAPRPNQGLYHTGDFGVVDLGVAYIPGVAGTTYMPFFEGHGGTVDRIACIVQVGGEPTGGSVNVRMAIYNNDDNAAEMYPGTLVVDSGNVAINAGDAKYEATISATLERGRMYWLAITYPTDATLNFLSIGNPTSNDGAWSGLGYDLSVSTDGVMPLLGYSDATNHSAGFPTPAGDSLSYLRYGDSNIHPFAVWLRYASVDDNESDWKLIPRVQRKPII